MRLGPERLRNARKILSMYIPMCGLAALLSLLPRGLYAQTDDAQPVIEPPAVEQQQPMSTAEISSRTDEIRAYLKEVEIQIDTDVPQIEAIPEEIDSLKLQIEGMLDDVTPEMLTTMSLRDLENSRTVWLGFDARLARSRKQLETRSGELDGQRTRLLQEIEYLEGVRSSPEPEDLPPALLERVKALIEEAQTIRDDLRQQLDALLSLSSRSSELELQVSSTLQRILSTQSSLQRRLLRPDSPPLWRAWRKDQRSPGERFDITIRNIEESVREYARAYPTQTLLFFLSLPVLLLIGLPLRRAVRARFARDGGGDQTPALDVNRPFAKLFLVWLGLVPLFLLPNIPLVLTDIRLLLLAIPIWRIATQLAGERMQKPVRGLIILMVLDRVRDLFFAGAPIDRFLLLGIAVVAFALLWRLLPEQENMRERIGRFWLTVSQLTVRLGLITLLVAILVNLYGGAALGKLLVEGVVASAFLVISILSLLLVLREALDGFFNLPAVRSAKSIRDHGDLIYRRLTGLLNAFLFIVVLVGMTRIFTVAEPIWAAVETTLNREWKLGTGVSAREVLTSIVSLIVALIFARLVRFVLETDIFPRLGVGHGRATTASRLIYYVLVIIGVSLALTTAGFEIGHVALLASALGIGIGFGLQDIVNNFVSGIILAFERPIQVGDMIEVGELRGRVREIGLRASKIRTLDGAEVIVPNASLISGQVINWTLSDRFRRIDVPVGVAYGSDPRQVLEILQKVAREQPDVLNYPASEALFQGFGESSLDFILRFWTPEAEKGPRVQSEVAVGINEALREAGLEIPFPQRDLHLRSVDEKAKKALSSDTREESPPTSDDPHFKGA